MQKRKKKKKRTHSQLVHGCVQRGSLQLNWWLLKWMENMKLDAARAVSSHNEQSVEAQTRKGS